MKLSPTHLVPPIVALIVFTVGITWGLPSRDADRYLFGSRNPWTGAEILALTGGWGNADRAADHDANPLNGRDRVIVVNETDAQRAEIVQRFRLYTHQPDEMQTLRALAQMRPGTRQLDPKFYQYGGLWTYPVGAMLRAGSALGLLDLRSDVAFYLDHPEQFARFYVVMRAYSAAWGIAGVVAIILLVRRMTGCTLATVVAGVSFALLPVVVNSAHEAKPHLAGAVLLLWTILAAGNYVALGTFRCAAVVGAAWGAAVGMVLLSLPGGIILVTMVLLRPQPWMRRLRDLTIAIVVGTLVYGATNPYVLVHTVRGTGPLRSNVQNYGNFYRVADVWDGVVNGIDLIGEGTSPLLALMGTAAVIFGAFVVVRRGRQWRSSPATVYGVLLASVAVAVLAQFVLLGAHKPGEYGRFAILPDVALLVAAVVGAALTISPRRSPGLRRLAIVAPVVFVSAFGVNYVMSFARDANGGSRHAAADGVKALLDGGALRLAIIAEPAPYCLPPCDLFRWRLMLQPPHAAPSSATEADIWVATVDRPLPVPPGMVGYGEPMPWPRVPTRISWANKPVLMLKPEVPR